MQTEATSSPAITPLTKNPLPLSAYQEGQVRDLYYARVRGMCAEEIKLFAECARNRTVSATWACRSQRREMNSCMILNATQEQQDAARDEWFRRRIEKRRLAEKEKENSEDKDKDKEGKGGFTQWGKGSGGKE